MFFNKSNKTNTAMYRLISTVRTLNFCDGMEFYTLLDDSAQLKTVTTDSFPVA